ncbi:MAG: hypothetical protein Q7R39_05400 [Dehalococcoidia bacterium]|nr:hypothetical protein [Dehalococcoidia bacterium]
MFSTDKDTVFPLQAALGYDITQTLFVGRHALLVEGSSDFVYLKWFSLELRARKREFLDPRWTITPSGGIDKMGSFMALFGGNKLHVAVLTDFHEGMKKKVRALKESDLLRKGHVFSAEMYADQDEADVEDMLGRSFYVELVNHCYVLDKRHELPKIAPPTAPARVVKEVEEHFASLPPADQEFDHLATALFLLENTVELRESLPELDQALDRFERLFKDLNGLMAEW